MDKMFVNVKNYALDHINNEIQAVNKEMDARTAELNKRLNRFEQNQRRKNVLIYGIPSSYNIYTNNFIPCIGKEIGFNLQCCDIDNVIRFKNPTNVKRDERQPFKYHFHRG